MISPLVTVGIPTYNRATGLARTLESICAQTYRNLEIIVSDNASTDANVEDVIRARMAIDARIRYHRQLSNIGAMANFSSLVTEGKGSFFMWAADDDRWEPFFIESCVRALVADSTLAACQMEVQYEYAPQAQFPFFTEGRVFTSYSSDLPSERIEHLLRHVYGNLVYGVLKRDCLLNNGSPIIDSIGRSLNEIPMLVLLAFRGNIRVLPQIGMYKSAPRSVCEQAKWEQVGGRLPNWPGWQAYLKTLISLRRYHALVATEANSAIQSLECSAAIKRELSQFSKLCLLRHELFMALRWKPAVKSDICAR